MTTARDADALADELTATRADLSETIDELTHRLDVKARAKDKAAELTDRLPRPIREHAMPLVIGTGLLAIVGVGVVARWRRARAQVSVRGIQS